MEEINHNLRKVLLISAVVIPIIIISLYSYFESTYHFSNNNKLISEFSYIIAVILGAMPLIIGKIKLQYGSVTSISIYAISMYVVLVFISLFNACYFYGECL